MLTPEIQDIYSEIQKHYHCKINMAFFEIIFGVFQSPPSLLDLAATEDGENVNKTQIFCQQNSRNVEKLNKILQK